MPHTLALRQLILWWADHPVERSVSAECKFPADGREIHRWYRPLGVKWYRLHTLIEYWILTISSSPECWSRLPIVVLTSLSAQAFAAINNGIQLENTTIFSYHYRFAISVFAIFDRILLTCTLRAIIIIIIIRGTLFVQYMLAGCGLFAVNPEILANISSK